MTDITDQDRRAARRFAEAVARPVRGVPRTEDMEAAARVILATVDAPAPTLADEMREWERRTMLTIADRTSLEPLITRAERIEQDLDEARVAAKTWQEQDENDCEMYSEEVAGLLATLAETREALAVEGRRVEKRTAERDEARAEVERLVAEVESMTTQKEAADAASEENAIDSIPLPMPPGDIPGTALPIHRTRRSNSNSLETANGSLPDPADVKPGEAWDVVHSEIGKTTAVRRSNGAPWYVVTHNGGSGYADHDEITLVSRLVPAPRVITDPDELDGLAEGTIILGVGGQADLYRKHRDGVWMDMSVNLLLSQRVIRLEKSVTVLWEPES